tara:strand:+ start:797 stop:1381 length:585 start_codon:yes stop_codon:yes gene_type:complete
MEKRKAGRVERDKFNVELTEIYNYVCDSLRIDISLKRRTKLYVNGRTLFLAIATNTTNASREHLGTYIGRDHSTVTFGVNVLMDELLQNDYYKGLYDTYANFKAVKYVNENIHKKDTLSNALIEINRLKGFIKNINKPLVPLSVDLTPNEINYRGLSDEEKVEYDIRAKTVLKSFIWKRKDANRKEVFETINCA